MLAKKFALGFALAVILPFLVYYGVSTFSPPPKWDYQNNYIDYNYSDSSLTKEERKQKEVERKQRQVENEQYQKDYQAKEKQFQKRLFFVAAPLGLAAMLIGSFIAVPAVGTGLMFGGVFTFLEGILSNWTQLEDSMKFGLLLVSFVTSIWIGYKRLSPHVESAKSTDK